MTETNPSADGPAAIDEIAKSHHAVQSWDRVIADIQHHMARRGAAATGTVVLVPYVQLIPLARSAWLRSTPAHAARAFFMPRFETTQNWTKSLGGFSATGDDVRLDAARDALTAASLLVRAGLGAQESSLAGRLMEVAWSLSRLAAAVAPAERGAWGSRLVLALGAQAVAPLLELEARIARIAIAWVANSAYPTDSLFSARADLLVLLQGFLAEPLHEALRLVWGRNAVSLPLDRGSAPSEAALHQALDPEDEAEQAAACVLCHLTKGRSPVALVAQDRVLTRRVRALLAERGVVVRDETGWTLSTTRAAAAVMGVLRAAAWDASTDVVLDWAKNAPAFDAAALTELEIRLRRKGTRDWRAVPVDDAVTARVQEMREALQQARPLRDWLLALRTALQHSGQWPALLDDEAGQAVLDTLRLQSGAEQEFADVPQRMAQSAFVAWVSQALEAGNFSPPHPAQAQLVILPSTQLLGRPLAAVVFPGCDEARLPASPEAPGMWTAAQRLLLGLPSREQLATLVLATWRYALRSPHIDILWRGSENGERLMPSVFVQELLLDQSGFSIDPRVPRSLQPRPGNMPQPDGRALPVHRLSASGYEDLRRCPYRFFALRQLRLQESDELDTELGKRDFGNWLHALLRHFHEALSVNATDDPATRLVMIDVAAERASRELGLAQSEFLPFAASWQRVRVAYLKWLAEHEASGARFVQAEASKEMPLGKLTLAGRIDRMDRLADGTMLVIDYKTESRGITSERIRNACEDTQLPFYAALLNDDTLAAMYLNIGETQATHAFAQTEIVELRDQLVMGIEDDMQRIGAGARLPALGEGTACAFCAARGLCRKDFWESDAGVASGRADV